MNTQNPTPDATATPRTPADKLATELIVWSSLPLGTGINQYEFSRVAREAAKLLRELTAAKAQLRERTQWQCKCGGTDCAGQAENERLRAEVERLNEVASWAQATLTALNVGDVASGSALHLKLREVMIQGRAGQIVPVADKAAETDAEIAELIQERDQAEEAADKMASEVLGEAIDWPFHDAAWQRAIDEAGEMRRELYMRRNSPLIAERDQLRARVAELEADKARFVEVINAFVSAIEHKIERAGGIWTVATRGVQLGAHSWASNVENSLNALRAAIDAAHDGKGAT